LFFCKTRPLIHSAKVAQEVLSPLGGQVIQASALAGVSALDPKSLDVVVMSSFLPGCGGRLCLPAVIP